MANERWTDEELQETVDTYFDMWYDLDSQEVKKAYYLNRLKEVVHRSSIHFRMQHISKIVKDLGYEPLPGYKPLGSCGADVARRLRPMIEKHLSTEETYEPTADPELLDRQVQKILSGPDFPAPVGQASPQKIDSSLALYLRDAKVKAWVLRNANGNCELCKEEGPFLDKMNRPHLVVHHVQFLGNDGADTIQNAVALCPNCHSKSHYAKDTEAVAKEIRRQVPRIK